MFKSFPFFLALFLAPVFPSLAQDELPAVYPFAHHGEWGLIDANRQVILEPSLAYIQLFRAPTEANALTIATEDGRKGLLRRDGEWAFRPLADSIGYPQQAMPQLHWATLDDRYGLVTTAGQPEAWLIHPQFTEVNDFEGNKISLAVVATAEGRGVVNQEGEFVAPCIYDEVIIVDRFSDYPNLRLIKDGEVTYLDAHGMPREPDQEVQAMASWETAVAAQSSSVAMSAAPSFEPRTRQTTDALGNTIVSRSVYNRTTGRYETVQEIMVPYGYEITDIELANLEKIRYIMVSKNGQTGFISGEGGPVDPVMYDFVEAQSGRWRTRHFLVGRGERVGLLNENAAPVLPVVFSAIEVDQFTIKVTHPDDYIGYADWEGHVFLPIEIGE